MLEKQIKFIKMHGLGNDYVFVNCLENELSGINLKRLAQKISNRNFGVGADGLILIKPSVKADFKMQIFNADGTEGNMCGNGIRCLARYIFENSYSYKPVLEIETRAGVIQTEILKNAPDWLVKVDMGQPELLKPRTFLLEGKAVEINRVSTGNPHGIIFVKTFPVNWQSLAQKIQSNPVFRGNINIELVKIYSARKIELKVWERGAGPTLACGTGACASVFCGIKRGLLARKVTVKLPGGILEIGYESKTGHIFMTGPAEKSFEGVYFYSEN